MNLVPDNRNANKGTARGKRALRSSLTERGAGRGIVCDRNGKVIAGNKTLEQAQAAGIPIRIIDTDGTELIVVQRTDLNLYRDAAARRLAYDDNRIGQIDLEWEIKQIVADLDAGIDLSSFFYESELDTLIASLEATGTALSATDSAPTPVLHYNIMFGDFAQQKRFQAKLRYLKEVYLQYDTPAARFDQYLQDTLGDEINGE